MPEIIVLYVSVSFVIASECTLLSQL